MDETQEKSEGLKGQLTEAMKKIVLTGVGTIFLTEETIRSYLGDIKLPKELWSGLLENAQKSKDEFLTKFAKEAGNVLSQIDFAKEGKRFFEGQKMKIQVEISFEDAKGKKAEIKPE